MASSATDSHTYAPISDYAIIGDMRAAALVGKHGSIDWCCWPEFDSPSVFGALLDAQNGGYFRIAPLDLHTTEQRYWPATNVVITTFLSESGDVVELCDFMPVAIDGWRGPFAEIHRRVRCTHGAMRLSAEFVPRLGYAESRTRLIPSRNGILATDEAHEVLTLAASPDLHWDLAEDAASVEFTMRVDEELWFVARYDDDDVLPLIPYESARKLDDTIAFWSTWAEGIDYTGRYREHVQRSALVLKLLCYEPTGATVAAPTTSLPEEIGGVRNWDYRFAWLRDSALITSALSSVGQFEEADDFMTFVRGAAGVAKGPLPIMYGIDGRRHLDERSLLHLDGYRGSRPVRVGNAAYSQIQLDVYGELLRFVWDWSEGNVMDNETWAVVQRLIDWICANWRMPDNGIWEIRGEPKHYVFSKVMCWVAIDYGIRMAEQLQMPADIAAWREARSAIDTDVMVRGWNVSKQSFVLHYGTDALDAANLLIPIVGFLPPTDWRVQSTVRATLRELYGGSEGLIYRYRADDGLPGGGATFACCAFWAAQALGLSGEREWAERLFEHMLQRANHVGLYSEQLDARTGEFRGNFPLGLTHVALINCANIFRE